MRTRIFRVGGMTCAACANRINTAVEALDGVQSCNANIGNNTATVVYDDSAITEHIKNIRAKLRTVGCEPIETVWGVGYKWKREQQ